MVLGQKAVKKSWYGKKGELLCLASDAIFSCNPLFTLAFSLGIDIPLKTEPFFWDMGIVEENTNRRHVSYTSYYINKSNKLKVALAMYYMCHILHLMKLREKRSLSIGSGICQPKNVL